MKYYIWANGEEHGPYEAEQFRTAWESASLPQGFLWRRESATQFSTAEGLAAEFAKVSPAKQKREPYRLYAPDFTITLFSVLFLIGLLIAGFVPWIGWSLSAMSALGIVSTIGFTIIRGLREIILRMDGEL